MKHGGTIRRITNPYLVIPRPVYYVFVKALKRKIRNPRTI